MSNRISFLILDYNKPEESKLCLDSIRNNVSGVDYEIVYLSNGGDQDYVFDFYKAGLIDKLILNKVNNGCGNGTHELFAACSTEYAFYVQNDQILIAPLDQERVATYIKFLQENPKTLCIDVAGAQAGLYRYSERAHFINVEKYLNIPRGIKGELGGPGPFNNKTYVENYVQKFAERYSLAVIHDDCLFQDNGKWSIRSIGDGVYKHRCDTKEFYVLKCPTYKTPTYPPFNDEEWDLALNGKWVDGTVPKEWEPHVFTAYS